MPPASAENLALLYRLSQTFNSSLDLHQVLNDVMDEVIAATRAERGFLMLRDPDGKLTFRVARGMDHRTIDSPQFQISRSVVDRVASEGAPRLASDAQTDAWLGGRTSVVGLGLRSILCVPIRLQDVTLGVIYVDNRLQAGIFTRDDLELLNAIASTAAIAIENARLYQVAVEKGRMERELQMARQVQSSLIPREMPPLPAWELATLWQPARLVGGDFYDVLPAPPGCGRVAIGDVSDKGMGAALFMAVTRSILRASAAAAPSPAECISSANRLLAADATRGMFVTLFYAELEAAGGRVTFVNAGHNPPLLYRAAGRDVTALPRTGLPLGIDETAIFGERPVDLGPGDFLLLYTDGITEAANGQGHEWGIERLRAFALAQANCSARNLVAALQAELSAFASVDEQYDDMTVMVLKRV